VQNGPAAVTTSSAEAAEDWRWRSGAIARTLPRRARTDAVWFIIIIIIIICFLLIPMPRFRKCGGVYFSFPVCYIVLSISSRRSIDNVLVGTLFELHNNITEVDNNNNNNIVLRLL